MSATQQPVWKTVANLGDASPLEYGGYFVQVDETGVYPPEAELLEQPADDIDVDDYSARWTVRRVVLDRCTDIGGILSDNQFHPEHPAWFADDLESVAQSMDYPTIRADLCSTDPIALANAYRAIGDYHGWDNLDEYPLELTRAEVEARYPDLA